jgi:acetylornithine deacetylase/succinyl-diaminopimelate desuccinylase-like protein
VVRYRGSGERPPLLLYGHTDVVTVDAEHWTHRPFSGDLADGCIWGRGALDMKSMVAQELMIMLLLQRSGVKLSRDVIFAATADEEGGGQAGMGFLVDERPDLVRAEYGLSEGGGTTMYVGGRPLYDVRTAEKGTYRFHLRARGEPGHGSIPRPETAVSKLAATVDRLARTTLPLRPTPSFESFFAVLCDMLSLPEPQRRPTEENLKRVYGMVPAALADYLRAISHDTVVPTGLRAGKKINVIPSEAEAAVDGRYLPGQDESGFLAEIREIVGPDLEIEPVNRSLPLEDPPESDLYETIKKVLQRHAPQARLTPIMLSGATDAKHVSRLGTRCLGFAPVKIGDSFPADQLVHGHDERIPVDGYLWGLNVLYDVVTQFCA